MIYFHQLKLLQSSNQARCVCVCVGVYPEVVFCSIDCDIKVCALKRKTTSGTSNDKMYS